MEVVFSVEAWSAFAPGLEDDAAWLAWARAPWLPEGDAVPALAEMPPMQRRRVERLGRAALQVAWRCQGDDERDIPSVFASRHGDLERTHRMLSELAHDQPLSPTQFGLSTHNAIPAQYSIARVLEGNYVVVSAGAASAEAAVIEAQALLADGAPAVLVVVYDGPTPDDYAAYRDEPEAWYAWAWRVVPARDGLPVLSLEACTPGLPGDLPHGLEVLKFFLAGDRELPGIGGGGWVRRG
ncbi:MAG: 3-oxoacyl-ACP synthase [Lysobacteraceae bacterium]|nr:MAG: 3-oxoacyl-ACP synthase [Xanthomonadaceae bacterium]